MLSVSQLDSALRKRWPLERIQRICKVNPPTPGSLQNLVALGTVWDGELYGDQKTGFDRIYWYASVRSNRLDEYSLNATKGHQNWIVEIGDEESLSKPPGRFTFR